MTPSAAVDANRISTSLTQMRINARNVRKVSSVMVQTGWRLLSRTRRGWWRWVSTSCKPAPRGITGSASTESGSSSAVSRVEKAQSVYRTSAITTSARRAQPASTRMSRPHLPAVFALRIPLTLTLAQRISRHAGHVQPVQAHETKTGRRA